MKRRLDWRCDMWWDVHFNEIWGNCRIRMERDKFIQRDMKWRWWSLHHCWKLPCWILWLTFPGKQESAWKITKTVQNIDHTIGTISTLHRPLTTGVWWTAVAEPDNFSQVQLFEKLVTKTNLLRAKIRLGCRIPSYLIPIAVIRGHWCVLMVYN